MRIRLIPLKLNIAHIDFVMTWVNDPETTQYFAGMQKQISREDEIAFIKKLKSSKHDIVYSVFDGDEYIGQVSINQIHWPSGEGRLFLVVVKKHQQKGYAHEILKAIQDVAFRHQLLHRLYLIVRPENEKGIQLYHRCGFRQEGYLYKKYKIGDHWVDMIQMVILKEWWETWWKE